MISTLLTAFRQTAGKFRRSERGNVALIFAVSLIPMLAATGSVVDYTRAAMARSQLQDALDATRCRAAHRYRGAGGVIGRRQRNRGGVLVGEVDGEVCLRLRVQLG